MKNVLISKILNGYTVTSEYNSWTVKDNTSYHKDMDSVIAHLHLVYGTKELKKQLPTEEIRDNGGAV